MLGPKLLFTYLSHLIFKTALLLVPIFKKLNTLGSKRISNFHKVTKLVNDTIEDKWSVLICCMKLIIPVYKF